MEIKCFDGNLINPIRGVFSLLNNHFLFFINITLKKLQYNNLSQSQRGKTHGHLVPTMNGSHNEFVQLSN